MCLFHTFKGRNTIWFEFNLLLSVYVKCNVVKFIFLLLYYNYFIVVQVALTAASLAQVPQVGPQKPQWGPQYSRNEKNSEVGRQDKFLPSWTTCDPLGPKMFCNDCTTRVICKPSGGILVPLETPCGRWKRYCNNGMCSPIPTAECRVV